jgi:predicted nucleic acid-binding protein
MGLILDSSVAIAGERGGLPVEDLLAFIRGITGSTEIALSVLSVMELEHGIGGPKTKRELAGGGSSWKT